MQWPALRSCPSSLLAPGARSPQELFGCEAKNEFKIFLSAEDAKQAGLPETMYSLEESSCFQRVCFGNKRGFTQTVWSGPLASLPKGPRTPRASPSPARRW